MKKKKRELEQFVMAITPSRQDREHTRRVLAYAGKLANKTRKCDYNVLFAAAMLHDIGRTPSAVPYKEGMREKGHAALGAAVAYDYLINSGWNQKKTVHVCDCIKSHSRGNENKPLTIEAKILYDADKLDMLGAVGLARAIGYAHDVDQALWTPKTKSKKDGDNNQEVSVVDECMKLANNTYKNLQTKEGRRLASTKIESMRRYYFELKKEARKADKYRNKY